ncbi:ABC transporter permease [Candidatus Sumerlaeota bacterium]|nr:ABC transporter permease [Candidatus Sumerlaeota bacterium]
MGAIDIGIGGLAAAYALLILPCAVILWLRIPMLGQSALAIARMTVQLLFVGFYLEFIFKLNNFWLNAAWVLAMIVVAEFSIVRGCELRLKPFLGPLFLALMTGTAIPLLYFLGPVLHRPGLLDAQYAIPICGMILGNCLRADIVGVRTFFTGLRKGEAEFQLALSQGATLQEALRPHLRDACQAALTPTVATIATIGLVSLPGMMTGVILGGSSPMTAIQYQLAIMIAIFSGTALTVAAALLLSLPQAFTPYGVLNRTVLKK